MTKPGRILVVDDEPSLRFVLTRAFNRAGYEVVTAETLAEARVALTENNFFCVFLDIMLSDGSGLDLLREVSTQKRGPSVVVMTAEATMSNAVAAMKEGAFDYLTKPFDLDVATSLAARIAANHVRTVVAPPAPQTTGDAGDDLIGRAAPMQEVFKVIGRAANSDATVLITGPTGSGKELVARAFHRNSSRSNKPYIMVNCAAIPGELLESILFGHVKGAFTGAVEDQRGRFLLADGGSLLLDEIGDMSLNLQSKILRALQEGEVYPVGAARAVTVDVRLLASTHQDLMGLVASGNFREDLYHRLNVVRVTIPPLAERSEDIPDLVEHFLGKIAAIEGGRKQVSSEVMEWLRSRSWPGNVRELENTLRRVCLMSPGHTITKDDLPNDDNGGDDTDRLRSALAWGLRTFFESEPEGQVHDAAIAAVESELIREALRRSGGVRARAARLIGINRNTLMKKIADLNIEESTG